MLVLAIDWAVALGAVNLTLLVALVGVLTAYHNARVSALKDRISHLEGLTNKELLAEMQSHRQHYEERRRRLDSEAEEYLDQLAVYRAEAEVARTALDTTQEQLELARVDVSKLRAVTDQFVAGTLRVVLADASYLVRSHLAVILGYSQSALGRTDLQGARCDVAIVERSATCLAEEVEELVTRGLAAASASAAGRAG